MLAQAYLFADLSNDKEGKPSVDGGGLINLPLALILAFKNN